MELDKIAPALVAFQSDLTPVSKSATNPFFKAKYAPLPEVMEAIQPLLAKHKLAVIQLVTNIDGVSALNTIVLHESGQRLEAIQPLLLTKQDPQAQGSAITYARRYGVMSALGIVADEDDDGNKAVQATRQPKTAPKAPQATPAPKGDTAISRAKKVINEELERQGITAAAAKKAKLMSIIRKSTIDTIEDANKVMDNLEGVQ